MRLRRSEGARLSLAVRKPLRFLLCSSHARLLRPQCPSLSRREVHSPSSVALRDLEAPSHRRGAAMPRGDAALTQRRKLSLREFDGLSDFDRVP